MIPVIVPVSSKNTVWFEYLLQPAKFQEHLATLKQKDVYPLPVDLIKMFLAQATTKNSEGNIVLNKNKRAKKLCSMSGEVILELELSLEYIEERFPLDYQGISIASIPVNTKPNFTAEFLLHRWIIRSISKGTETKYLQTLINNLEEFENQTLPSIYQNSFDYLSKWISPQEGKNVEKVLLYEVNFELAEYSFIRDNINDAYIYFLNAKQIKDSFPPETLNLKKMKVQNEQIEAYLLTCQSILSTVSNTTIDNYSRIQHKIEYLRISGNNLDDVINLLIEDTSSFDSPTSMAYRQSLEPLFENSSIQNFIICCNSIHSFLHFDGINIDWTNLYDIMITSPSPSSPNQNVVHFLFEACKKLRNKSDDFARKIESYLSYLSNILLINSPTPTLNYNDNCILFSNLFSQFQNDKQNDKMEDEVTNSLSKFYNADDDHLSFFFDYSNQKQQYYNFCNSDTINTVNQSLQLKHANTSALFHEISKNMQTDQKYNNNNIILLSSPSLSSPNTANLKKKAAYYSAIKQWDLSKVLYENANDRYNCYFVDLQTSKSFEFKDAMHMLSQYGAPPYHILEYFISMMLNKNQFQDLQRYCQLVDLTIKSDPSVPLSDLIQVIESGGFNSMQSQSNQSISPAMSQCMAGVCEMGIALGGICESIKSDVIDYQKLANFSLLFLNRFRKQDSSLRIILWEENKGILNSITNTTILDGMLLVFASILRLHSQQSFSPILSNDPSSSDPSLLLISPDHFPRDQLAKLTSAMLTGWNIIADTKLCSQFNSESLYYIKNAFQKTAKRGCSLLPHTSLSYLLHADALFEQGEYDKSVKEYLTAGCVENAFYSNNNTTFSYDLNTFSRMMKCLINLQAYSQAAVLSQWIPLNANVVNDYASTFHYLQIAPQSLDVRYFQYFFEVPILEFLVSTFAKRKDDKKVALLVDLLSKPEINQNNSPQIRKSVKQNMEVGFFKELCREFLNSIP